MDQSRIPEHFRTENPPVLCGRYNAGGVKQSGRIPGQSARRNPKFKPLSLPAEIFNLGAPRFIHADGRYPFALSGIPQGTMNIVNTKFDVVQSILNDYEKDSVNLRSMTETVFNKHGAGLNLYMSLHIAPSVEDAGIFCAHAPAEEIYINFHRLSKLTAQEVWQYLLVDLNKLRNMVCTGSLGEKQFMDQVSWISAVMNSPKLADLKEEFVKEHGVGAVEATVMSKAHLGMRDTCLKYYHAPAQFWSKSVRIKRCKQCVDQQQPSPLLSPLRTTLGPFVPTSDPVMLDVTTQEIRSPSAAPVSMHDDSDDCLIIDEMVIDEN